MAGSSAAEFLAGTGHVAPGHVGQHVDAAEVHQRVGHGLAVRCVGHLHRLPQRALAAGVVDEAKRLSGSPIYQFLRGASSGLGGLTRTQLPQLVEQNLSDARSRQECRVGHAPQISERSQGSRALAQGQDTRVPSMRILILENQHIDGRIVTQLRDIRIASILPFEICPALVHARVCRKDMSNSSARQAVMDGQCRGSNSKLAQPQDSVVSLASLSWHPHTPGFLVARHPV